MLFDYVKDIRDMAYSYLENTVKPTSIFYPKAKDLASNLTAEDGSIVI